MMSCRVERMELLLFSADFAHFDKVDQVLKAAVQIKNKVELFDMSEGDTGESINTPIDILAETSCCSYIPGRSDGEDIGSNDDGKSAVQVHAPLWEPLHHQEYDYNISCLSLASQLVTDASFPWGLVINDAKYHSGAS